MNFTTRDFILLLLCVLGAVNVLLYILTSETVGHVDMGNFVDIDRDDRNVRGQATVFDPSTSKSRRKDHTPRIERQLFRKLYNTDLEHQQPGRIFNFPVSNYEACSRNDSLGDQPWEIVIIVISAAENFLRRQAIRNTWGSMLQDQNATILYLVGKSRDRKIDPQIWKEAELYSDIVQVDLKDSYDNLTLKCVAMLQWLNDYCTNSKFYLKTDDDVFVNVPYLVKQLGLRKEEKFFMCHVFKNAPPIRDKFSKWYTSKQEFSNETFPTYCSGTAYAFSSNIILDLHKSVTQIRLLRMEDVFITGLAVKDLNVEHVHHGGFSFSKRAATGCAYENAITGHEVTTKQMYVIYSQLQSKEIDCQTGENMYIRKVETDLY